MAHAEPRSSNTRHSFVKSERLEARVSVDQKRFFLQAADLLGITLTEFLISSLNLVATDVIEKQAVLSLSTRDQKRFIHALFNPEDPSQNLVAAKKRYQRLVQK